MATPAKPARPGTETIAHELSRENAADNPVVQELRRQVANAFVLYTNYKHYHWQTFGPLFRDLHKFFDELADDAIESIDPLAERMRMIGQDPPFSPVDLADLATIASAAPHSTMRDMVEEADRNLLVIIRDMRKAVKVAEEQEDPGTVDLFTRLVQSHEKYEWWLRDMLKTGDGLCT